MIDKEDISKISKYEWIINVSGFVITKIRKNNMIINWHLSNCLLNIYDYFDIMHKNGDKLDCRKENLIIRDKELPKES